LASACPFSIVSSVIKMATGKDKEGHNESVWVRAEFEDKFDAFKKLMKAMGKKKNDAILELCFAELERLQGKDPGQVSTVNVQGLESELFKLAQDIEVREKNLRRKSLDAHHTIYDALYNLAFERLGFKKNNFAYDDLLRKLYHYRVTQNDDFNAIELELFVQIVERKQSWNKIYTALQDTRSGAKGNLILAENLTEPSAMEVNNNEGEDEEPEKPSNEKASNIQPEPIIEDEEEEDKNE
jgi:uncharacterized protein YdiU (UPF0061 family)